MTTGYYDAGSYYATGDRLLLTMNCISDEICAAANLPTCPADLPTLYVTYVSGGTEHTMLIGVPETVEAPYNIEVNLS